MRKIIFIFVTFATLFSFNSFAKISYTELYITGEEYYKNIDDHSILIEGDSLIEDPFEPFNRIMFSFNYTLDYLFMKPISYIYMTVIPINFRGHVGYFFNNLSSPITFVNDILQGDLNKANTTFWRFVVNTFLGGFGLMDVAKEFNLIHHKEDFDQTLAKFGISSGPYLVLPLLGPTTFRGVIGKVADYFSDPFINRFGQKWKYKSNFIKNINDKSVKYYFIDNIIRVSVDPYTTIKSMYIQNRNELIKK